VWPEFDMSGGIQFDNGCRTPSLKHMPSRAAQQTLSRPPTPASNTASAGKELFLAIFEWLASEIDRHIDAATDRAGELNGRPAFESSATACLEAMLANRLRS